MTVKDLIEQLKTYDPDEEIILFDTCMCCVFPEVFTERCVQQIDQGIIIGSKYKVRDDYFNEEDWERWEVRSADSRT